jgi:GNAT superfamily N-acetyltransferase
LEIIEGNLGIHAEDIQEIFWEYLHWRSGEVERNYGVSFNVNTIMEEDLSKFLPPAGRLLLAYQKGFLVGIGCLKKLKDDTGEIKRMYVRPHHQRQGVGKVLLNRLLAESIEIGYSRLVLSSAKFMEAAHAMYRSYGFQKIKPYPDSEIPGKFQSNWIFMQKLLNS